jgi:tetratricopeptide (TPR) repeat protein
VNWLDDNDFQRALSALQAGNLKEAERLLQASTRTHPRHVPALNLLGVVLGRLGRNAEAIASYDRALAAAPDSVDAWYGRGMTLLAIGRRQEAIVNFDRVIMARPNLTQVHLLRAKLLADLGQRLAALEAIRKLLDITPSLAEAWLGRSNILFEDREYKEALIAAERAVALKPDLADVWHGLGNVLNELGRHDEALSAYDKALALNPHFAGAWHGRGNALNELRKYQDALVAYDKALVLVPELTQAWLGRGNVLNALKRSDEAFAAFDRALVLDPGLAEAWLGRGNVFTELKRLDVALASYDKAIALKPDFATAYFNRARGKLIVGRYKESWKDYEWRWEAARFPSKRPDLKVPEWQGEDISGRHLLVYSEQGLGDIIQFIRYLPLLAQRGCKLTFFTLDKLTRLFRQSIPSVNIINTLDQLQPVDAKVALISLPYRFDTDLSSVPNIVPYLKAEAELETSWRTRIDSHGFKIGIAWQGNPIGTIDEGRSIPLKEFVRLSQIPGVRLISLQKHAGLDQLSELANETKIETLGDAFDNGADAFIDTAAVMTNLDLIITCDTSIAHLAGALGRSTWVALKYVPDWRWMLDREDSPWYPTLRLFRQPQRDDWRSVFLNIEQILRALLRRKNS